MDWARILAYVTGMVDQELLARNEYLAAENRILRAQLKGRLQLSDAERATLGEIRHRLGCNVLAEVANVARPDTILAWYRRLVARWAGSCAITIKRRRDQTGLRDDMEHANQADRVRTTDQSGDRGTRRVSACRERS
jgi:uncharacterized membrane protein